MAIALAWRALEFDYLSRTISAPHTVCLRRLARVSCRLRAARAVLLGHGSLRSILLLLPKRLRRRGDGTYIHIRVYIYGWRLPAACNSWRANATTLGEPTRPLNTATVYI